MHVAIHVSARGNVFMQELAGYVAAALRAGGNPVTCVTAGIPDTGPDVLALVLAPHEYCTLDPAFEASTAQDAILRRCVLLNTEQPGTPWFERAAFFCALAGVVLDVSQDGVDALGARGIPARHLPIGYHPDIDRWGGRDRRARDLDVVFMGDLNPRRSDLLAQYARLLAPYRCELYPTDSAAPVRQEGSHFVLGADKSDLLCRTRLLLDLHRGPRPYFAWQRALPAFANGAVVVTEPASGLDPLQPFAHLVVAPYDLIPYYLQALLHDEPRREAMARAAYQLITTRLRAADAWPSLEPLFAALAQRNARTPAPARATPAPGPPVPVSDSAPGGSTPAGDAHALPPVRHSAIVPPCDAPPDISTAPHALLKKLALAHRRLERSVAEMRLRQAGVPLRIDGEAPATTPAWRARRGDVSVVVALHNHEEFVDECLASVLASRDVVPEAVVIDDGSTDGSVERVRAFMARHPELPVAHVRFAINRGLSAARNQGFRHARSAYVFVLDVDNLVYPTALSTLRAALAGTDAGFAYCVLEQFGTVRGLMNRYPWEAERLVRGNYIDAMAMITRTTWERVGGYVDGTRDAEALYGWEDWDFWLRCAGLGIRGIFVPRILARYRSRIGSMISITNLETASVIELLRQRHPSLDWGGA